MLRYSRARASPYVALPALVLSCLVGFAASQHGTACSRVGLALPVLPYFFAILPQGTLEHACFWHGAWLSFKFVFWLCCLACAGFRLHRQECSHLQHILERHVLDEEHLGEAHACNTFMIFLPCPGHSCLQQAFGALPFWVV